MAALLEVLNDVGLLSFKECHDLGQVKVLLKLSVLQVYSARRHHFDHISQVTKVITSYLLEFCVGVKVH